MAGDTPIEWADSSWNPIAGCQITSPGCKNCYAMPMAARIERMAAGAGRATHYAGTTMMTKTGPVFTGKIATASDETLSQPMRWRRPRRIFVNSMGDLFAPGVTDAMRDRIWAVMACAPWHTFMVLTKRAPEMRAYLTGLTGERLLEWIQTEVDHPCGRRKLIDLIAIAGLVQPLRNVWAGVTAEDQARADERIPELLDTPAAVRIVSVEPMIGPVRLRAIDLSDPVLPGEPGVEWRYDALAGEHYFMGEDGFRYGGDGPDLSTLDWVIVGGESGRGPGIRPMNPAWALQVRDDCAGAGVPFFFKQWGSHLPCDWDGEDDRGRPGYVLDDPACAGMDYDALGVGAAVQVHGREYVRFAHKRAPALLDGVAHHAWPEART